MKRIFLGCAIALPLTLACDNRPAPDETARIAESDVEDAPQALQAPAANADHECNGDCDGDPAPAKAAHQSPAGTQLAADVVAGIELGDRPVRGNDDAKVSIVVFSDFECPFCAKLLPSLDEALDTYGDDVSVTFKQMPLPFHTSADAAARASLAAAEQGKFWEMHDALFANPTEVRTKDFAALAEGLELDVARFERDMADPEIASAVARDIEDAKLLGIRGTPSMLIGDQLVVGAQPVAKILEVVDTQMAAD